jgi:deazaflavin-dependent oxidoreductase (nitroreductase family)
VRDAAVIEAFRANGGRVGGSLAGTPILLLHHRGARSGVERVTPLAYTPHGDDHYLITASSGGSPAHPRWYHNLKAHPTVEIEAGAETFRVQAEELDGAARDALWPGLVAASPSLRDYEAKAGRTIPLFRLTRLTGEPAPVTARSRSRSRRFRPLGRAVDARIGSTCPCKGAICSRQVNRLYRSKTFRPGCPYRREASALSDSWEGAPLAHPGRVGGAA